MEERWSDEYLERQRKIATLETPTITRAKSLAGLQLSLLLFEQCHRDLRVDFGLEPFLEGPPEELWVSPSDLLIGKVALTPPLTQKHIQALTHQGILELGAEVEQKFKNEMQMEQERALKHREEYLRKLFASEMEEQMEAALLAERMKFEEEMNALQLKYDNRMCQVLTECYEQVKSLEEQMQIECNSLNVIWLNQLELEVQETINRLTEEFLEKMRLQEQVLVHIFTKQIKYLNIKRKCEADYIETKSREFLIQMKHKLHCHNISNLMYLLCKERRKCKNEKIQIRRHYQALLRKEKQKGKKKDTEIKRLLKIIANKTRQLEVRERCLIEILRQFQRFIYFALKATPTQGEYLLNIDKLIKFELQDFCLAMYEEEEERKETVVPPPPVDTHSLKLEAIIEVLPTPVEYSDVLPAFYFDEKMYVREDFRDMFSAGMELDETSSLWNPDVEELLNIFKANMVEKKKLAECQIDKVKSYSSNVHFDPQRDSISGSTHSQYLQPPTCAGQPCSREPKLSCHLLTVLPAPEPTSVSPKSSVSMRPSLKTPETRSVQSHLVQPSMDDVENEREIKKGLLGQQGSVPSSTEKKSRRISMVITKDTKEEKRSAISVVSAKKELPKNNSMTQSRLTLTRDSMILHLSSLERKSLMQLSKHAELSKKLEEVKNSKRSSDTQQGEASVNTGEDSKSKDRATLLDVGSAWGEDESDRISVISQRTLEAVPGSSANHTSKLVLATDSVELIKSTMGLVTDKVSEKVTTPTQTPTKAQKSKQPTKKKGKSVKSTPRVVTKVAGSGKTKEHETPVEEFTEERIKSLVNVMKENPSLIRLFTPCHQ